MSTSTMSATIPRPVRSKSARRWTRIVRCSQVDIVQPITVNNGDPYFIAYKKKSGELTLNRIHGDCLGWTKSDTVAAKANAGQVVPLAVAHDKNFLLVV